MENKKSAKKPRSTNQLEISGRLKGININGSASHFQFALVNKSGSSSYLLDPANQSGFATLAAFVTSAYMAGKKIHVKATRNGDGLPIASEIRIGAKPKAPKVKKPKAPEVKKAKVAIPVKEPLIEPPPAA